MLKKTPNEFQQKVMSDLGDRVMFIPERGALRIDDNLNDVYNAIYLCGGVSVVAKKLKVRKGVVEQWIDEHFVPGIYAEKLHKLSKFSIDSLQKPPIFTNIDGHYWPPAGYLTDRNYEALFGYKGEC